MTAAGSVMLSTSLLNAFWSPSLHKMCIRDRVMSLPEDSYVSFGWSSPWPMDQRYEIHTDGMQSEITYYAMTSEPHRWVWKEQVSWKELDGIWYAEQERFKEYDGIGSADEFEEAYGGGIAGTPMDYRLDGMGEALNRLAGTDAVYQDLFVPGLAMEYLLNLHGGEPDILESGGQVTVVYTFADESRAAVTMIRPFGEDGIWIPEEVAEVPGTAADSNSDTVTSETVVRLAGIHDAKALAGILSAAGSPVPDRVDGKEDQNSLTWSESYGFTYKDEPYQLFISYNKEDDSLSDIILMRLNTSEWLNIYRTPEEVRHYGMTLADEAAIRSFFDTHVTMKDYLTYRLPEELSNGGYSELFGNSGGGNLFVTSDPAAQTRLEELSRYVDQNSVPESWRAAGAVERYTGNWPSREIRKGSLMKVGLPWNHTSFTGELVSVTDCEVPALLTLAEHDMYTAASLEDTEKKRGPVPEENRTSRMWYVFFAKEGCGEMYSISLNADLYQETDLLKIARSVHFTDQAWTAAPTS